MAKSCKGLAMELVKCLSESDCVKVLKIIIRFYNHHLNKHAYIISVVPLEHIQHAYLN
ncbi:putative cytochrome c oxidase assembly protein PET191 [Helianthus annuus]|nr:putative cytochrome c oxidase assembly protein PET191 [Helianthus annuus]